MKYAARGVSALKVRKGDSVLVISGEYKGKRGKVLQVLPKKNRLIVEGVNIIKKHTRPTRENPQGGIVESPGPISVANVMVVCSRCDKPTRIKSELKENGDKARVCRHCGREVS